MENEEESVLDLIRVEIASKISFEDEVRLEDVIKECFKRITSEAIDPLSLAFYTELIAPFIDFEYLYFKDGLIKTPLGLVVGKLDVQIGLDDTRAIINSEAKVSRIAPKKQKSVKPTPSVPKKTVEELRRQVDVLRAIKSPDQRSAEWYAARHTRLTASDLAGAIGESKYDTRFDILKKKVMVDGSTFTGNFATRWGQKFEDIAVQIYSARYREEVLEFGMIEHPTIPFLGASPDGIIERSGTMLEIKCPVSRVIDGSVPRHYEIQMQLQLEVCDLDLCHFLECKFSHYDHEILYWSDGSCSQSASGLEKGVLIEAQEKEIPLKYVYCPLGSDKKTVKKWVEESKERLRVELPQTIPVVRYWRLEQFSCVAVHRDRDWFQSVLPKITSFWHEVTYYRSLDPVQLFRDYNKTMPVTVDQVDEGGDIGTEPPAYLSDTDSDGRSDVKKSAHGISENKFLPESDDE